MATPKGKYKWDNPQMDWASQRINKSDYQKDVWASWTNMVNWFIEDDYKLDLAGSEGRKTYDEMRKSDSQINAVLLSLELPIRATQWYVEVWENSDWEIDEMSQKVKDFIEKNLFERMDNTWDDLLREILTMLAFWFSVFEKVYTWDWENIWLKKLWFRKQNSIFKWETETWEPWITQLLSAPKQYWENKGKTQISIPAMKLVIFSYRREGDNYEWTSILRSAYKNRYIKDKLYKFDAIHHERQSVWIPIAYLPAWASKIDIAKAEIIVSNIRATQQTWVVVPGAKNDWWLIEFLDTKAWVTTNMSEMINHHDRQMAKNVLAQFLELWNTASWSRALSEDQSDMFLLSLSAIAKQIADTINRIIIPEIVDFNFDIWDWSYPKLKFKKLGDIDYNTFSTSLSTLVWAWVISNDTELEEHARKVLDLPKKMEVENDAVSTADDDMPDWEWDPKNPEWDISDWWDNNEDYDPTSDIEDIDSEIENMSDPELTSLLFSIEFDTENFGNEFKTIDEETKQKISDWLKKYWDAKGRQSTPELSAQKQKILDSIDATNSNITAVRERVKSALNWVKSEIEKIRANPDKKARAIQIKALKEKWKETKAGLQAEVENLKGIKAWYVQNKKEAQAEIKNRKEQRKGFTTQLKQKLEEKKITRDNALSKIDSKIQDNNSRVEKMRDTLKSLDRKFNKEQIEALRLYIKWVLDENKSARTEKTIIRNKYKDKIETIKNIKDEIQKWFSDENDDYRTLSKTIDNSFIINLQNEIQDQDNTFLLKKKGFKFNEFETVAKRALTFAERKVNFSSIQRSMDSYWKILDEKLNDVWWKTKEDLINQIKVAIENNDIKALWEIKAKYKSELSQIVTDIQKEMFEIWKKTASTEMWVQVPPTKTEVRGAMRVQNDALVEDLAWKIESAWKLWAIQVINTKWWSITTTNPNEIIESVSTDIDNILNKVKNKLNTFGITWAINLWRASIFERYPEKIYAMQYSAILDERTTEMCRSLDWRVVKAWSAEYYNYSPPLHYNCRSIWVEILQDETFKPNITGIPGSIPAYNSIDNFKDLKIPQITKDSPAKKIIEQEIQDRKTKLDELKASGKYLNRQKLHQDRINELENAIKMSEQSELTEYIKKILSSDWIIFK